MDIFMSNSHISFSTLFVSSIILECHVDNYLEKKLTFTHEILKNNQ